MLQIRPTCEHCDTALAPDDPRAMICSYECTYCETCVAEVLEGVCPNCGGDFVRRPVRPRTPWREGVSLGHHPASTVKVHKPVDARRHAALLTRMRDAPTGETPEK